jgi:hypothetical protein
VSVRVAVAVADRCRSAPVQTFRFAVLCCAVRASGMLQENCRMLRMKEERKGGRKVREERKVCKVLRSAHSLQ